MRYDLLTWCIYMYSNRFSDKNTNVFFLFLFIFRLQQETKLLHVFDYTTLLTFIIRDVVTSHQKYDTDLFKSMNTNVGNTPQIYLSITLSCFSKLCLFSLFVCLSEDDLWCVRAFFLFWHTCVYIKYR